MKDAKMTITSNDVEAYIQTIEHAKKSVEAMQLYEIFKHASAYKAAIWATKIIGFGDLQYTYKTGHQGRMPYSAFAVQKQKFTLYLWTHDEDCETLLKKLGKFKRSKACLYVNKLSDINLDILKQLITASEKTVYEHFHA